MERPTIQKNNLNNLGKMNILKKDQTFILELFKQAILSVNDDLDMAIIVNMTKFGQKDEREFDLGCLINTEGVCNVSYHAACTVCPLDPSVDILWSRCGLQEVVGTWGTLFPVYSMSETAKFPEQPRSQEYGNGCVVEAGVQGCRGNCKLCSAVFNDAPLPQLPCSETSRQSGHKHV